MAREGFVVEHPGFRASQVYLGSLFDRASMVDARKKRGRASTMLARDFKSRKVQVALVVFGAMVLLPFIAGSMPFPQWTSPWLFPVLELVLGSVLIVAIILYRLDTEVQRVRDEGGLGMAPHERLRPRRWKGWFFSLDNTFQGKSLAYLAFRAYIYVVASEGYRSISLDEIAVEFGANDAQKKMLGTLFSAARDEGLLVDMAGKSRYALARATKHGKSIKKEILSRLRRTGRG